VWLICHRLKALDKDVMSISRTTDSTISSFVEVDPSATCHSFVDRLGTPVIAIADLLYVTVGMLLSQLFH
jgi:hypothetical protein